MANEQLDLESRAQASLSISGTGAQSAPLDPGIYDCWSDVDCFIKVGATASDVLTTTGYILWAGNVIPVRVDNGKRIGAITSGASGTLRFHEVG